MSKVRSPRNVSRVLQRLLAVSKQGAIILLISSVLLVVLELVAGLFVAPRVRLVNDRDPKRRAFTLSAREEALIRGGLRWNMVDNVLTYPDERLIFRVRPNPEGQAVHGYTGIDELGFRGKWEGPSARPDQTVLVLGDSCAFGWGILDVRDTFAERLRQRLPEGWALRNLGQPGYSTEQVRVLFEEWDERLPASKVAIYLGWNDVASAVATDATVMELFRWQRRPVMRFITESNLYGLASRLTAARPAPAHGGARVPVERSIANLRTIVRRVRDRRGQVVLVRPLFVRHPELPAWTMQLLERITPWWDRVSSALKDETVIADLRELEADLQASFQADGFHPNERGAAHIASAVEAAFALSGR